MNYRFIIVLFCSAFLLGQTLKFTSDGFRVARAGYVFQFPRDHGNHPDFKTEWWYVTGHLFDKQTGNRYGYQLTFFRQASPKNKWKGNANWKSDQIYMAHAAITNEKEGSFTYEEKLNRGGILANSKVGDLDVYNESWFLRRLRDGAFIVEMNAKNIHLSLKLIPQTPLVIFGDQGVSVKGDDPTAASHYLTFPRMQSEGFLKLAEGNSINVEGLSWMDHEISSNQLGINQSGWDWAGIQLNNGFSLMFYRLRLVDGTQDEHSVAFMVDPFGKLVKNTNQFTIKVLSNWTSPHTGTNYPSSIHLIVDNVTYLLEPILKDQELVSKGAGGLSYWEGSCRVKNLSGQSIGNAYVELTGYAKGH